MRVRHDKIEALLLEKRVVSVSLLANLLGVSEMTVRRDLKRLEGEGRALRIHGGAVAPRASDWEPPYMARVAENVPGKAAIGCLAARMVEPGDVLFIDVGTTLLHLAHHLPERRRLTVITNWIPIVQVLSRKEGIEALLVGGAVRSQEMSTSGGWAVEMLQNFNAAKAFLGVAGVSSERGCTDYNLAEIEIKRAMMRAAQQTFVLADHTKIGRVAPYRIALQGDITMITDQEAHPTLSPDAIGGGRILVAPSRGTPCSVGLHALPRGGDDA